MYEILFSSENKVTKNNLLDFLKKQSREISVFDLMEINAIMLENEQYVQDRYKEEFHNTYAKHFLARLNQVKNDKTQYKDTTINMDEFKSAIIVLERYKEVEGINNPKFYKIYCIISLYTTFILHEPIHPVGTLFPGSLRVEEKNGKYYCPVKDANKETPNSVCPICIAEQLEFR